MQRIPTTRTPASAGRKLNLKMHPLIEDVADVNGGGRCRSPLALLKRRFALRVCLEVTMMQLADTDSDFFAVDPNRDVTNLSVPRWDGDDEPVSELHAKVVPCYKPP